MRFQNKRIRAAVLGFLFLLDAFLFSPPLFAQSKSVTIQWFGQSCFLLQTDSYRILIDPYNADVGYPVHNIKADAVFISHEHFDHDNEDMAPGAKVYRGLKHNGTAWNIFKERLARNITLRTVGSYHDDAQGKERGLNSIGIFTINGLHFVHLGDLGHSLTEKDIRHIGPVDVLFIPVGGVFTINGKQAQRIAASLLPRLIIPMHYNTKLNKIPLQTEELFLDRAPWPVQHFDQDKLVVTQETLPKQTAVDVLTPEPLDRKLGTQKN